MPELSVIMPARNAEATIRGAVTSTLRAMPRDAELVVLNDGSTDTTRDILDALSSDARLKIIDANEGRGVAVALNILLEKTDSRMVARMDADDFSLPWRFTATMPALNRADVVFSTIVERSGKKLKPGAPLRIPAATFPLHLLMTNPVSHPTMLAKRETIDAVGGYRKVPSEDYDLWMRCAIHGAKLERISLWSLVYLLHPGQITASKAWRNQSWEDPDQAAVFADLSTKLTGRALRRLVQIAALPPPQKTAAIEEFSEVISPLLAAVTGLDGHFLRRRLDERIAWVRRFNSESAQQRST